MKKLTLDLETLVVDAFATESAPRAAAGTVHGNAAIPGDDVSILAPDTRDTRCVIEPATWGCPKTLDLRLPECVCDITRTCPTFDIYCPVEAEEYQTTYVVA